MEKTTSTTLIPQGHPIWDSEKMIALLSLRRKQLISVIQTCEKTLQRRHDYSLHQHTRNGFPQYYLYRSGESRKYIPKTNTKKIKEAAQCDYDRRLLNEAKCEYQAIDSFLKHLQNRSPESVYSNLDEFLKELVDPRLPNLSHIINSWRNLEYPSLQAFEKKEVFKTAQGVTVRSKSELLIAERLEKDHIPYKYECPLLLSNGRTLYPDFTILHPRTLQIYYWEHFGMVDDPIYAAKMTEKINAYGESNILIGQQLLLTMESNQKPLDIQVLDNLIHQFFQTNM